MASKPLDMEKINKVFQSMELRVLDSIAKGTRDEYNCIDKDGYMYYTKYRNIYEGNQPEKVSSRNPYSIQNIGLWLRLEEIPFELVTEEYTSSNSPMKWKRTDGDKGEYITTWSHFLSGGRKTREEYWRESGATKLNTSYNTDEKMTDIILSLMQKHPEWKVDGDIELVYKGVDKNFPLVHVDGYRSQTSLSKLRAGYIPSLFHILNSEMKTSNMYMIIDKRSDYTLKENQEYKGTRHKYTFTCSTHGEFTNTLYHVYSQGYCPQCGLDSRSKENHVFWKNEKPEEERVKERKSLGYKQWRKAVFERDDYTCAVCEERGGRLHAHHKDGYHWCEERRLDVTNGVTLCRHCHIVFHSEYGSRQIKEEDWDNWMIFIYTIKLIDRDRINRMKDEVKERERRSSLKVKVKKSKEEGVGWSKYSQRWKLRIKVDGKWKSFKTYKTEEEAIKAKYRIIDELKEKGAI